MKVWLVIRDDWEDSDVVAVWSTEKAAKRDCKQRKAADKTSPPYGWRVQEHEVQSQDTKP